MEIRKVPKTVEEQARQADRKMIETEPFYELLKTPAFIALLKTMKIELKRLERLMWTAPEKENANLESVEALNLLGLSPPKDKEEKLEVFVSCRACVNFWDSKLSWIQKQAEEYDRLLKRKGLREKQNG